MKPTVVIVLGIITMIGPLTLTTSPPRQPAAWTELFNRRDLAGWHQRGGGKAFVLDGLLVLEHDAERRPGYLICDLSPLKDFEAVIVCRIPTGDSGFFFRGEPHPLHATEFQGPQVQLNMQPGRGLGGIFELHGRCWVSKPEAEVEERARQRADWITCELTVKGPRIRVRTNGVTTVDIADAGADNHFQEAGRFALQIHGGGYCRAEFRRIAVRRLD